MKNLKHFTLFIVLFLMTCFVNIHANQTINNTNQGYVFPEYYVDFINLEEKGTQTIASIYLTNGAHFLFQVDKIDEEILDDLIDELEPGSLVNLNTEYKSNKYRIDAVGKKHSFLVGLGRNSKQHFLKIIDIKSTSTGGWFSSNEIKLKLSDGSTWLVTDYIQERVNYWNVGDHVIPIQLFHWKRLINLNAPSSGTYFDAREADVKYVSQ